MGCSCCGVGSVGCSVADFTKSLSRKYFENVKLFLSIFVQNLNKMFKFNWKVEKQQIYKRKVILDLLYVHVGQTYTYLPPVYV